MENNESHFKRFAKKFSTVVRMEKQWFVACLSDELAKKPVSRTIFDIPLVLFRNHVGHACALLDRCPHRNVPLSLGQINISGNLRCPYHGWEFNGEGTCERIPCRIQHEPSSERASSVPAFKTIEQQGFIWVYFDLSWTGAEDPKQKPHWFQYRDNNSYSTVTQAVDTEATLYSTIENALDVPHTAFLHRGLFRHESKKNIIRAKVRRTSDRVEAQYLDEPRPSGIIARILSPSGGTVTHFDRFILPSIAQVEYKIGEENHIFVDSAMTPTHDFRTRIYSVVSFRSRIPHAMIEPFIKPLALRLFEQDARILKAQTSNLRTFGGEQFVSTEIDVLGKHILRLLKSAARGELHGSTEEREVVLVV